MEEERIGPNTEVATTSGGGGKPHGHTLLKNENFQSKISQPFTIRPRPIYRSRRREKISSKGDKQARNERHTLKR